MENQQLADHLNVFYCRFEKARLTPSTCSDIHFAYSPTPPATPIPPSPTTQPVLKVCVEEVFRKQKSRKASGPDGISPACLKVCIDQLAPIFTQIYTDLCCAKFPVASNAPPSFPSPKRTKSLALMTTDLSLSHLWS